MSGAERGAVLVALSVLVLPGPHEPVPAPHVAESLERLELTGRIVILAGSEVAGRRLPEDDEARERWVRATVGAGVEVVGFTPPAWEHRDPASETAAVEAWAGLRGTQRAVWLITDRPADVRPARRAGLLVVEVGPRSAADDPLAARADIDARDLADAARLLLASDLFGRVPADL